VPSGRGPGRLARLVSLLSFRTISGRLIIGLVALVAVASVAVSVVTDSSLNQSLMGSLKQELQTATSAWYQCVQHSSMGDSEPDGSGPTSTGPAGQTTASLASPDYAQCSGTGSRPARSKSC